MIKFLSQISLFLVLFLIGTFGLCIAGSSTISAESKDNNNTEHASIKAEKSTTEGATSVAVDQVQFKPHATAKPSAKDDASKAIAKPEDTSATILSYNFIFYIIHKFKHTDFLGESEKKDRNTNSFKLTEKLTDLGYSLIHFFTSRI